MSPARAEGSLAEHFERIRADLERIQEAEQWPRAEIFDREGDHHFSVRIEPVKPLVPSKESPPS